MMDGSDHHDGTGWRWVIVVLLVVLIIAVTVLLVRHFAGAGAGGGGSGAASDRGPEQGRQREEDVLADRFARGEIDENEYRSRRAALRE